MDGEQMYIGYKDIFRIINKRIYLFIIIVIIILAIALLYRILWQEPIYETRVSLIIGSTLSDDQSQFQIQDINTVKDSMRTYIMILKTNAVAVGAIDKLGLNVSANELKNHIEALPQPQTSFMEIKVKWHNSDQAFQILEAVIEIFIIEATRIYPEYKIKILETVEPYPIEIISIKLYYFVSLFVGSVMALSVVLMMEFFDNKIKSEKDVDEYLNIPLIGKIPKQKNMEIKMADIDRITKTVRYSVFDSFRTLRTNLLYLSISASLLAAALAENKKLTLLIDCDLKKPVLHEIFKTDLNGLSNILMEESSWQEVVYKSGIDNLYILPAGINVFNADELIFSNNMRNLLFELREAFDFVILDTPSIETVSEEQVKFMQVDGYLAVVAAGESSKDTILKMLKRIQFEGGRILGILLTKMPPEKKSHKV